MILRANIPERIELSERLSTENPDEFCRNLPDYLEFLEHPKTGYDCWEYALGPESKQAKTIYEICDLVDDESRQAGDIMVYLRGITIPTHAAIYEGDNTARSKWGEGGPVLRHKIHHVPRHWGSLALFFREKS